MEKQNIKFVLEDDVLLQSITNQFKSKEQIEVKEQIDDNIDFSKVDYNNYYINNGIQHIKSKMKSGLDDPIINILIEESAKNIVTPLEEWNNRNFINNNIQDKKDISYITYLA